MDPDANLREQRELSARILGSIIMGSYTQDELERDAERLAELVESNDEWLARGGCLPKAWDHTAEQEQAKRDIRAAATPTPVELAIRQRGYVTRESDNG